MAINRELSQFASFVEVDNTSRNIGIATTATPFVGIGTTNPIAKFEVVGHTELDTVNISGIVTSTNLKVSGIATFLDYAQFSDNASAYFGNGADLRIFHDGSNSYIQEQGDGNLYIQSNSGSVNIRTSATANENAVVANSDGSVDLYYDNSKKFATTGTGVTIFGDLVASGIATIGNISFRSTGSSGGIVTATDNVGIITYYGDGSNLSGIGGAPGGAGANTQIVYNNNGSFAGSSNLTFDGNNVYVAGIITATDFNSLSDSRYKEHVTTIDSALSKVDQLRGVKFDWKESGLPSYGVIAQELEEVVPELVHGEDPKTVNYNGIIGVLIEAIKELKSEVEELKRYK